MENRACLGVNHLFKNTRVGHITRYHLDPSIRDTQCRNHIEEDQLINVFFDAFSIFQRTALEQRFCQSPAEKAGPTCD